MVSEKIKLLAERKPYGILASKKTDRFDDVDDQAVWRWEVICLDILPLDKVAQVKVARMQRRRLGAHYRAIGRLAQALNSPTTNLAKISMEEEKVLKYEREEEKARLLQEQKEAEKKKREEEKQQRKADKEEMARLKEEAFKKKREEKEENLKKKKEERDEILKKRKEEKEEALKKKKEEREEAIKRKKEEREEAVKRKRIEMEMQKEIDNNKRKERMMSYFSTTSTKKRVVACQMASGDDISNRNAAYAPKDKHGVSLSMGKNLANGTDFNSKLFHQSFDSVLSSSDLMQFWAARNHPHACRKKKAKWRKLSVAVAVPSSAFCGPAYSEHREVLLHDRTKYLHFWEDYRPPYYGTWSKRSNAVSGRRPFGKDGSLDYEYASEEEWEEEGPGEDCQADGDDDSVDEGAEAAGEDFQGWLVDDDDFGLDDEEEDSRKLRRQGMCIGESEGVGGGVASILVAPGPRGEPIGQEALKRSGDSAFQMIEDHRVVLISTDAVCLDAFEPPSATSEKARGVEGEMLEEFIRFIHSSTVRSKSKLVDEYLEAHPGPSKMKMLKKLDTIIGTKSELAGGSGCVWTVKESFLEEKGLMHLKPAPVETSNSTGSHAEKDNLPSEPKAPKIRYTRLVDKELKLFVRFIQEGQHKSKEALVKVFVAAHQPEGLVFSKKHATEKLLEIGTKIDLKGVGWIWDVPEKTLEGLDMMSYKRKVPKPEPVCEPLPKKRPILEMFSAIAKKKKLASVTNTSTCQSNI
mmetsp:Transcript_12438/g.27380  ORF Transcript_12438/g.27380 Transcript_12438/m.27380 type:complete len:749 (+) Transcript_12438:328-2574(+)